MRAGRTRELRESRVGFVGLVLRVALVLWAAGTLCLLIVDLRAAAGLGVGGGVSIGVLALYRALVKAWVRPERRRRRRIFFAVVWFLKWPALGTLLYFAMKEWQVSVAWLCVGLGAVPAVVTAAAIWALLSPGWRERMTLEMD